MARDRSRTPAGRSSASDSDLFGDVQLNVQTHMGKIMTLNAHSEDTIDWVKAKIDFREVIPPGHHLFVKLEGGRKLSDYNLPNGCTLHLMKTSFRIRVNPQEGDIFLLDVEASDTIDNVKAKIQDKIDLPRRCQSLGFRRCVKLVDGLTLSDYDIRSQCTVLLTYVDAWTPVHSPLDTVSDTDAMDA